MTFPKFIKKTLLKDESVIKMAVQKSLVVSWAIINFLIPIILLVVPLLLIKLNVLPAAVNDFLVKFPFVEYIFICVMVLWLLIILCIFIYKLNNNKKYSIYLTNRRALITQGNTITTLLFPSILGVAMRKDEDENYAGIATIEIHTPNKIYEMKKMRGGNQVIGMLLQILFGSTIEVTKTDDNGNKTKENFNVEKKTLDNKIVEKQKEVKRVDTEPVTPKPIANDKIHSVIGEKKEKVEEE